jgi:diguanylate cyclase (GGDEF)-like protein/PAS domain S-box-containing protein
MDTGRDANGTRSLNRHTLEQIVAASSAAVLVADVRDARCTVTYVNSAYERLMGRKASELVGRPWALLERATDPGIAEIKAAVERREACRVKVADVHKDGTASPCEISLTPLRDARGEIRYFLCDQRPLTTVESAVEAPSPTPSAAPSVETTGELPLLPFELGRARPKTAAMERVDPATGLLRFGYFQETLRRDLAVARRDHKFVTLLVFEIVEFDAYRRTYGDKAADSCQRMIGAQIMRTLRRGGDLCARYDASTLVAAALGQEAREIQPLADQIADHVRQLKLHNPRAKSSRTITVRVTLIGCSPGVHEDPEPVIARMLAESRSHDAQPRAIPA